MYMSRKNIFANSEKSIVIYSADNIQLKTLDTKAIAIENCVSKTIISPHLTCLFDHCSTKHFFKNNALPLMTH